MNRLLLIELKRLMPSYLVFWAIGCIALFKFDSWTYLIIAPPMSAAFLNLTIRRSAWYLNLPWSRAKVLLCLVYQNTCMLAINVLFVSIMFTIDGKFFYGEDRNVYLFMTAIFYLISYLAGMLGFIVYGVKTWNGLNVAGLRWLARAICAAVFIYVTLKLELLIEPVFLLFIGLIIAVALISYLLKNIALPMSSSRKILKVSSVSSALIFVGAIMTCFFFSHFGKYALARPSLDLLHKFPVFLSEERAKNLFVKSGIGVSPAMSIHSLQLGKIVSLEEWKKRTRACVYDDCLDFSSDVLNKKELSEGDLEDRFLDLMAKCKFELKNNNVTCDTKLSTNRLISWIQLLSENGILSSWLKSSDPKKQIIAMKGLPLKVNDEDLAFIGQLVNSKDALVKATAAIALVNINTYRELKLDCDKEVDEKHLVCKSKTNDMKL